MKTKRMIAICAALCIILTLVLQAGAVSRIGFLDPYWGLRFLMTHRYFADPGMREVIWNHLVANGGYFPLLDSLGMTMCWSLADDSVLQIYNQHPFNVKLASEWYPDSTWKYVSPQRVIAQAGEQSGPIEYIYFPPPDPDVGDAIRDPEPNGPYVVRSRVGINEAGDIVPEAFMGYSWLGGWRMYNLSSLPPWDGTDTLFFKIHFKWDSTSGEAFPCIADIIINPSEFDHPEESISLRDRCLQNLEEQTRDIGPFPTDYTFRILRQDAQAAKGRYDSLTFALGHIWASEDFRLKVYWPGYHSLYIDRIEIYDRAYRHLFYDADWPTKLTTVTTHLINYDYFVGDVHYNFRIDEPNPRTYRGFGLVYNQYHSQPREISVCLNGDVVNANFLNYAVPDTLFFFYYPLGGDSFQSNRQLTLNDPTSIISTFFTSLNSDVPYDTTITHPYGCSHQPSIYNLQHGWDRFTGSPDHGDEFLWGLYRMREIAVSKGKPWAIWLQAGQEVFTHEGTGLTWIGLRDPTPNEMHCMVWLALSYGTDGIGWYRVAGAMEDVKLGVPDNPNYDCCPPNSFVRTHGLLDWTLEEDGPYAVGAEAINSGAAFNPTERFYAAKGVSAILDTIGPILDGLQWRTSVATRAFEQNMSFPWQISEYVSDTTDTFQTFMENLETCEIFDGEWVNIPESPDARYVQTAIFTDNPPQYDNFYLMFVNRRCLWDELGGESRGAKYTMNMNGRFNPFVVKHYLGNQQRLIWPNGLGIFSDSLALAPGHGELVRIWPGLVIREVNIMPQGPNVIITWSPPEGVKHPSYFVEASTDGGKTFDTIGQTKETTFTDPLASVPMCLYRVVGFEE